MHCKRLQSHILCSKPFHVCSIRSSRVSIGLQNVVIYPGVISHHTFSYMHTVNEHNYAILSVAFTSLNTDSKKKKKFIYASLHKVIFCYKRICRTPAAKVSSASILIMLLELQYITFSTLEWWEFGLCCSPQSFQMLFCL